MELHTESKTNKKTVDSFYDLLDGFQQETRSRVSIIGDVGMGCIVKSSDRESWMLIVEDVSGEGRWRTQGFDLNGFFGHSVYKDKAAAIENAAQQGYFLRDDDALDRIQATHRFQTGMYALEQLSLLNCGAISMDAYLSNVRAFREREA